ncbi:MAG TPA: HAD family phosphatase [Chitinophagales bacterium]|nr:HAD family phosphatase [Chitinophagales bacterium]
MPVKNIIFDLGGVIIDIEPERSLNAFAPYLNGYSEQNIYQHRLFHELETGRITASDFRNQLRAALNISMDDTMIDECMFAMLGEIPEERIRLLEKMKQRYKTILLSNTNVIHYDACSRYLQKAHGTPSFDTYFHKTYYSHLVGLRKPDVRIFELVLRENALVPEETLYLDDTGEHLKSARTLGIITVKVTPENSVVNILKDY